MKYALAFLALGLTGCCSGVDPKTVTYSGTTYQAVAPEQTFGVTPAAKKALMIPADLLNCAVTFGTDVLNAGVRFGYCALGTVTPPAVVPVQAVRAVPGTAAAAPSCDSGTCGVPPPAPPVAAPVRGACLPPGK